MRCTFDDETDTSKWLIKKALFQLENLSSDDGVVFDVVRHTSKRSCINLTFRQSNNMNANDPCKETGTICWLSEVYKVRSPMIILSYNKVR